MRRALRSLCAVLALVSSGCGGGGKRELPECDGAAEDRARTVVYREPVFAGDERAGMPAFAGQALMVSSCGGGVVCHTPNAEGARRFGAPSKLNFDVRLMDDRGDELRLRRNQLNLADNRERVAFQVDRGWMPPAEHEDFRGEWAPRYRWGPEPDAPALPTIRSREQQEVLEIWLACGVPVVATAQEPTRGDEPGDFCDPPGDFPVGWCVVRARP